MTKVLMVCLGNICRSPLAEGILKSMVDADEVFVDSAGTAGYHIGARPDKRSIQVAQKNGLDITGQRARKFHYADFEEFDLIYAMDKSNLQNILAMASSSTERDKVRLLLEESSLGFNEVPDPYYGGDLGFDHVFNMVYEACVNIADNLKDNGRQ